MGLSLDASVITTGIINPHRLPPMGDGGGGVPTTRRVDTTSPLTGGGDLSADRTIAIDLAALGSALDDRWVNVAGDTMTGDLVLAADPDLPMEAATKQYVDAKTQSAAQANWQWNTNTTMADPGSGFMRANAAPASATQLAISLYDVDGTARLGLLELEVGDRISIYYADDISRWVRYTVSAAVTNNANTWVTIPVTVVESSGTFTPGNNQRITGIWSASSGGGGGGGVPPTRLINTTSPLTGGGDLSADRTLGIDTAALGTAMDDRWVNTNGDTMTGNLSMNGANIIVNGLNLPLQINSTAAAAGTGNFVVVRGDTGPALRVGTSTTNIGDLVRIENSAATTTTLYTTFSDGSRVGFTGLWTNGFYRAWAEGRALEIGTSGGAFPIIFSPNNSESARMMTNGTIAVGRTNADNTVLGAHYGPNGAAVCTNIAAGALIINRLSPENSGGNNYIRFARTTADTTIGSITSVGTTGVAFNTSSDYRLKDDRGPITGALDRLGMLKPRRVHWKETPEEDVVDGFFAHEVAVAVPEAVQGEKDAVNTEETVAAFGGVVGGIIPQQLDSSRLIPLLVAAVQELSAEVAMLRGASA